MSEGRQHQDFYNASELSPAAIATALPYYERESECTGLIAKIPTVWDETVALDGKVGGDSL